MSALDELLDDLVFSSASLDTAVDDTEEKMIYESITKIKDLFANLLKENEQLKEAHTWQPIETAPREWDFIEVLLADGKQHREVGYYSMKHGRWSCEDTFTPTHWMPVPKPPSEDMENGYE